MPYYFRYDLIRYFRDICYNIIIILYIDVMQQAEALAGKRFGDEMISVRMKMRSTSTDDRHETSIDYIDDTRHRVCQDRRRRDRGSEPSTDT